MCQSPSNYVVTFNAQILINAEYIKKDDFHKNVELSYKDIYVLFVVNIGKRLENNNDI